MSTREWDLLARLVRTHSDGLASACRELALAIGAERLYCVVEARGARRIYAFDYEGYPVASAETRLQPDLLQAVLDAAPREAAPRVVRRPALDVRGAAAAAAFQLASGVKLALVLEHRFGGSALASLDDSDLGRWLTLCAVAYRLEEGSSLGASTQQHAAPAAASRPERGQRPAPGKRLAKALAETSPPTNAISPGPVNDSPHPASALYAAVAANETGMLTGLRAPGGDARQLAAELLPSVRLPEAPRAANGDGTRTASLVSERTRFAERALFPDGSEPESEDDDLVGLSEDEGPPPTAEELSASLSALESAHWNISQAARQLGLTRHGLKKRMRRLGIRRPPGSMS